MAFGDIGAAIGDSLEYDGVNGTGAMVHKVADGFIIIFRLGLDFDGYASTYPIDAAGTIGAEIDELEFEPGVYNTRGVNVLEVGTRVWMALYRGTGNVATAKTITCDADGANITVVDTLATALPMTSDGGRAAKKGTTNLCYTLVWSGSGQDGYMATFTCGADGSSITNADDWEFEPARGYLCHVSYMQGDIFMLSYNTATNLTIASVSVADNGTISKSLIDTQVISNGVTNADMLKLDSGDLVMLGYTGTDSDGFIVTLTCTAAGALSALNTPVEFSGNLNTTNVRLLDLGTGSGVSYVLILYTEINSDNVEIHSYSSDASGVIGSVIDQLVLKASTGGAAYWGVEVQTDMWAFVMAHAPSNDGFLITAAVESVPLFLATWPLDAITRVTNLVHRYDRKERHYSLEIGQGDVTSDFGLPEWLSAPIPAKLPDGEPTTDLIPFGPEMFRSREPQITEPFQNPLQYTPPGTPWTSFPDIEGPKQYVVPTKSLWQSILDTFTLFFRPDRPAP